MLPPKSIYCNMCGTKVSSLKTGTQKRKLQKFLIPAIAVFVLIISGGTIALIHNSHKNPIDQDAEQITTVDEEEVIVANGTVLIQSDYEANSSIEVVAYGENGCYVYLKYIDQVYPGSSLKQGGNEKNKDVSFWIDANATATINIPVGEYEIFYATGETFYGADDLFGEDTKCYIVNNTVRCKKCGYGPVTLNEKPGEYGVKSIEPANFPK